MADNVTADPGAGGATFATDDDGTAHHPYVKLEWGADNTQTKVASGANALPIQDGGNSITVDGTVGVSGTVTVDGSGVTQPVSGTVTANAGTGTFAVSAAALPLPSGAATAAKQPALGTAGTASTDVISVQGIASMTPLQVADNGSTLSVDDGGGSLTVDGTVSVSGTVTVGSHAVTNAGAFAVQVDGAALTALQLIDNLVLAEDAAHQTGDPGVQALAVRNDSDASLAGTSGDYTPLQVDANGYLKVNIKAGAGSGGTASTDDGAFTAASGSGTPMMGFVTTDAVDSGDVGVVGMLANRQLKVTLFDSGGSELSVGGGTQYTEDAAAAANPVGNALMLIREDALAGSLTTADGDNVAARGNNKGEQYVKATDSDALLTTIDADTGNISTKIDTLAGTVAGSEMQVDVVTSALPSGASTLAEQQSQTTHLATIAGAVRAEDAAHASGHTGIPALSVRQDTAAALAGTDADYQPLITDASGRLHVNVGNTVTVGSHAVTNAGTFAVQVDGAALTALQLIDDPVITDDAAFTPGTSKVMMIGAQCDATGPDSVDEGDAGALRMTADRAMHISIRDSAGNNRGANVNASNQLSVSVDNTVTVASHAVTNAGTFAVQVDGAALTALQLIDNASIADDAAFTPGTTGVNMAGFTADETSTDSVDEGDGGAARMTLDRRQIVVPQPHSSGGLSIFRSLDIDETEEDVKTSAGAVYGVWVTNTATSTRWLKFYNATAANVTVGTTTPVITIGIPGNSSDDISGNFGPGGVGIQFDTAISVAATTGVADNDTGAPGTNDVIVNIFYK